MEPINSAYASKSPLYSSLTFEEGWGIIQKEINKVIHGLETEAESQLSMTSAEYMHIYTVVFTITICDDGKRLYNNYKKILEDYISTKVLPSLRGKTNEVLLQELVKQWNTFKTLTLSLIKFFRHLERYFIPRRFLPSLKATSYSKFYELVYGEMNDQIQGVVLSLIRKEREGMEIDQALVKNVLDIYIEMGEGSTKYFEKGFEATMLDDAEAFYSCKAKDWVAILSAEDCMQKLEECLNQEKGRITAYLSNISHEDKLLDLVRKELNMAERNRQREEDAFINSIINEFNDEN